MEIEAIYTLWLREIKRFLRSKSRIVGNLSMPVVWLVIMGVGLNSTFSIPGMEVSYLNFMAPGIIGMTLMFTSVFSGVSVIWDKKFGFMKEILVAPVSRVSIVLGKTLGSVTISIINGILILIIAVAMGGIALSSLSLWSVIKVVAFMALISLSFVSLGLAIAAKLNDTEGFQLIMSFLVMPLFFLSGAFFPIDNAPAWMKTLSSLDPLFYGVDGLRGSILGVSHMPLIYDFTVLAIFAGAVVLIASWMFNKME